MFRKILSNSLRPIRLVSRPNLWREESGATAIITAITLAILLGFTALGVEVGSWYAERRALQTAADAAALGAAYQIYKYGKDDDGIVEAGEGDASRNGFTKGVEGVDLTVSNPPTIGPNAENDYAAEAIIGKQRTSLLSSMFLSNDEVTIRTRAVAVVRVGGPFCILALDPVSGSALKFGGTADLTLENCGLIVNSESNSAMNLIGGSIVGATYADITGNYTKSNNSTLDLEEGAPNVGVDPLPDPFADLNIPSGSGCDYTNFQTANNNSAWGGAPQPLSPGRYCGGLRVRNKAHMAPGNYVIVGGTFKVVSGAVLTSDPGVTVFLTGSAGNYAQADISGGATVQITAPSTGTYRGIAFFQDRNAPGGGSPNMFNGGSTMEIKGAIYIPKQEVQFAGGNTSSGGCTKIVAFTIEFTGNSDIDSDCTGYGFEDETRRPPKLME
jgi:hypothetical protein